MKNILLFLLAGTLSLFLFNACSSDEGGGGPTQPSATSITISASDSAIRVGESVTFSVTTNTGQNVTSSATISVDNTDISGNSFSPSSVGTYTVKATYNSFTSNSINVTVTPNYQAITLAVSANNVEVNDRVDVTVMADNGDDVTSQATITVNAAPINGSSFTADDERTYQVRAQLGSLLSNTEVVTAAYPPISSLDVIASNESAVWGETVTLVIEDNFGRDLAGEAEIFVDGALINTTTITRNSDASLQVHAEYEGVSSPMITITFSEPPPTFVRNVLIEDFQGTWCQFCPRVSWAIHLVEEQTDDVVVIGIHENDEMDRVNFSPLANLINLTGYPTAMLDRMTPWNNPETENIDQVLNIAGTEAQLGLSVDSNKSGNQVTGSVKVTFSQTYSQDLELVIYLLEDDLIYDQINFYDNLYGGQNPIPNFEHDGVLSFLETNILGEPISQTNAGFEYTRNFTIDIPSAIENDNNLKIAAFVIDAETNDALNAREGVVGELADYQEFE